MPWSRRSSRVPYRRGPGCAGRRGVHGGLIAPCVGIQLGERGIGLRQTLGELDDDKTLLEARVVLHLAVEHHRTRAVTHRLDDTSGMGDILSRRAEDALGDLDLHRVQRPGADAAEQEGVAELVLARDDVGDVAEGAVVGIGLSGLDMVLTSNPTHLMSMRRESRLVNQQVK